LSRRRRCRRGWRRHGASGSSACLREARSLIGRGDGRRDAARWRPARR
jgi:hypothetical protein